MSKVDSAYAVRRLRAEDGAAARALLDLFGEAFEEPATYIGSLPSRSHLTRVLESALVLAAFSGEALIGGLVAYDLPKLEREESEIYLYDLAVATSHRRQGVATALIRALQEIARDRNAWVIFVQADPVDPPAIALYAKLGTREDVIHFDIAPAR